MKCIKCINGSRAKNSRRIVYSEAVYSHRFSFPIETLYYSYSILAFIKKRGRVKCTSAGTVTAEERKPDLTADAYSTRELARRRYNFLFLFRNIAECYCPET